MIFAYANICRYNTFVKANSLEVMAATNIDSLETVFKALADKTRLRILTLLGDSEVCVCHIHDTLRLPQPTVSRHLAYLRRTGLVDARRDGVWIHYRVAESLDPVVRAVIDAAVHAVTHVPTASRDRKQFEKSFGDTRQAGPRQAVPCCAPRRAS
jgi:ArsR family transcriptional regulator